MQVLFVLWFYHPDKIDRLIYASSSKMAVKMSSVVKKLLYVLKLFRVTAGCIHSFRIRSKETLWFMYPKYPVLDMIQRIHLRCGSFEPMIRFSILVKKRYIRFRIKNPDLDFLYLLQSLIYDETTLGQNKAIINTREFVIFFLFPAISLLRCKSLRL